ncbi:App1 family protein [Shivajiella indica]|uniref:App1 family protein n=1 Tax=Shivajiella indica TaxID=872115 RepID=A0ABW5B4Z1_9BACT
MYKRFMSWEIPSVRIKVSFQGYNQIVVSDEEGYFTVHLKSNNGFEIKKSWNEVQLDLLDQIGKVPNPVTATNKIFIPIGKVDYGIISDIDDTIVPTGATRLFEMIKTTFLGNAHSRLPFPGVSSYYQALAKGSDGIDSNPFFYVSSSPWNLYDFLMEFLDVHQIPKGPLMLRDLGLSKEQFIAGSHWKHKLKQVEKIFQIEKNLQFILIGDSGQHDPEIYLKVIKDFPGRVKMVYIRDVSPKRKTAMKEIQLEMNHLGVDMLLVKDTLEAGRHALSMGWILPSDLIEIQESKQKDEALN